MLMIHVATRYGETGNKDYYSQCLFHINQKFSLKIWTLSQGQCSGASVSLRRDILQVALNVHSPAYNMASHVTPAGHISVHISSMGSIAGQADPSLVIWRL